MRPASVRIDFCATCANTAVRLRETTSKRDSQCSPCEHAIRRSVSTAQDANGTCMQTCISQLSFVCEPTHNCSKTDVPMRAAPYASSTVPAVLRKACCCDMATAASPVVGLPVHAQADHFDSLAGRKVQSSPRKFMPQCVHG